MYPGQTFLRPTPGTCRLTGTEGRTLRVGRVDAENPGGASRKTGLGFRAYSSPSVDRIWLWVYSNKIPIYPIFYLFKGDYRV